MNKVVAATLGALLIVATTGPGLASGAGEDPAAAEATEPGDQATSQASGPQDTDDQPPEDQAGSDEDVMKNVTRHRPGACPEGPPCKVED
jgi:hypothetical protein